MLCAIFNVTCIYPVPVFDSHFTTYSPIFLEFVERNFFIITNLNLTTPILNEPKK